MRRALESGIAPTVTFRLSATERAAYLTHLVTMNRKLETEDWLEISRPLALSATTRIALRTFWARWCEAQARITDYFTGTAEFPIGTSKRIWNWVPARLLFALVADESESDFIFRKSRIVDREVWIWCSWCAHDVLWGAVEAFHCESFAASLSRHHSIKPILPFPGDAVVAFARLLNSLDPKQYYSMGVDL